MVAPSHRIAPARSAADIAEIARMFDAYAAALSVDLAYQGFAAQRAALPGKYAPPRGELLLARDEAGQGIACVALRPIESEGCCEMKRLYVATSARGPTET